MRVGDDELDVLGTVDADGAPEHEERLLVVVRRDRGLRELRVEQRPEIAGVWTELENTKTREALDRLSSCECKRLVVSMST